MASLRPESAPPQRLTYLRHRWSEGRGAHDQRDGTVIIGCLANEEDLADIETDVATRAPADMPDRRCGESGPLAGPTSCWPGAAKSRPGAAGLAAPSSAKTTISITAA